MSKKNPLKRDLFTKKYKPRVIKPKKGKGSFKRKKNNYLINIINRNIICTKLIATDVKCDILKYFSCLLSLNLFINGIK